MLFWHKNVCSIDEIKEQAYSDNYEDNTVFRGCFGTTGKIQSAYTFVLLRKL